MISTNGRILYNEFVKEIVLKEFKQSFESKTIKEKKYEIKNCLISADNKIIIKTAFINNEIAERQILSNLLHDCAYLKSLEQPEKIIISNNKNFLNELKKHPSSDLEKFKLMYLQVKTVPIKKEFIIKNDFLENCSNQEFTVFQLVGAIKKGVIDFEKIPPKIKTIIKPLLEPEKLASTKQMIIKDQK